MLQHHQGHLPEVEYNDVIVHDEALWRCGELVDSTVE